MTTVNAASCPYCYMDIDINNHRSKLARAAAFVDATDSRYGFSSKDLRCLGGSELSRIQDLMETDHEWSDKHEEGVEIKAPTCGNRIVIKLFWDVSPLSCENFATLCINGSDSLHNTNKKPKPAPIGESGKPLTYRNSIIHRIVPNFIVQGGDFVFGNGSGGESIYNGKKFKDEKAGLQLKHDKKGIVSMGNSGKNSNTSQFFITFQESPQCDGKHVIFGEVLSGFEVLDALEEIEGVDGKPSLPVTITDCGAFRPLQTPGAGYWYDQPDIDSFVGYIPVFMVRPRVAIVSPTLAVYQKFEKLMGISVSSTPMLCESEDGVETILKTASDLLRNYMIDVIIVAPIYADYAQSFQKQDELVFHGATLHFSKAIIVAKPVEALAQIREATWIGEKTKWHLDF